MLRRALTSLICALALTAPAYGQDVFVPRELKATPAHPPKEHADAKAPKPKEEANPAAKEETAETAKTKAPKTEKAPAASEDTTKKIAKAEPVKEKPEKAPAKEKTASVKPQPPTDDIVTIKVEKATTGKVPASTKTVAKTEKDKSASKEKTDGDLPVIKIEKATASKEAANKSVPKTETVKSEPARDKTAKNETAVAKSEKSAAKEEPARKNVAKKEAVTVETVTAKTEKAAVNDKAATVAASKSLRSDKAPAKEEPASKTAAKTETAKTEVAAAKSEKSAPVKEKEKTAAPAVKPPATKPDALVTKVEPAPPREGPGNAAKSVLAKVEPVTIFTQKEPPQVIPAMSTSLDTGMTKLADGFDFPVGKPEAEGYYKARGFRPGGHVGEDWDGVRGGDTDLRDPIYSVGDGIVVFARDVHLGWGNVIIVRHAYRENGNVRYVDALYGHLNTMLVSRGQRVSRGQQIATMGTAHGQYDAHLHFEIRKNLEIGMSRSKFQKDFNNYYDPTQFINSHRHLSGGGANYKVAMNTFTHDWMFHFDKNRDFGSRKRSTSESSAALRRSLTSTH
jgi:murein DD-endopeptidase MepM/ murein hydrolase activator NlpD